MSIKLYVKIHNKTGLKYFGKTESDDVYAYQGSGIYWKRHIKQHGYNVTTIVIKEYSNYCDDLREFALKFSEDNDIVNNKEWANLIPENGGFEYKHNHRKNTKRRHKIHMTDEYNIMRQRRFDFEKTFGVFSVWDLLPFKRLPEFWSVIVRAIEIAKFEVNEKIEEIFQNIDSYVVKYIQKFFPT